MNEKLRKAPAAAAQKSEKTRSDICSFPVNIHYFHPDLKIGCDELEFAEPEEGLRTMQVLDQFLWIRVIEGTICFEVNMQKIFIDAGETLFINCRVPHTCRGVIKAPARVRILIAAPDAVTAPFLDKEVKSLIDDSEFSSTLTHPVSPLFSYDLDAIYDLMRHKPEGCEFEIAARYLALLRQYCRIRRHTNPEETVRRDVDVDALREMLAYIGENHHEEITVDQIAAAGGMSRSKCTRIFRRYLGKSPIEHVQQYRLEKSVFLLKNTNLSFAEISAMCGFNQQSYFNRLFIREYGITPRQMRRNAQRSETP